MNKVFIFLFTLFFFSENYAQNDSLRVLFLGNSYTYYNNLPTLTSNFSAGANKTLIVDSNTPGGYTLNQHSTNTNSLSKIAQGNWDVVVLQEQSQIPTIGLYKDSSMYPACKRLNDTIKKYNPCAKVVLYMTWGRRYGGRQCDNGNINCSPVFVNFNHMQDSLESAYLAIAGTIGASVAPVGVIWKNVLNDTSLILHTADNSHPTYLGSFIAAASFFQVFWGQSPDSSSFQGTLSAALSSYLKRIVDTTITNSATKWRLNTSSDSINFTSSVQGDSVVFTNLSQNVVQSNWLWYFGDGDSATSFHHTHKYQSPGVFTISLVRTYCGERDTVSQTIIVNPTGLEEKEPMRYIVSPNPFENQVKIQFEHTSIPLKIELLNLLGKQQKVIHLNAGKEIQLELSEFSSGIYFLKITQRNGVEQMMKILKN